MHLSRYTFPIINTCHPQTKTSLLSVVEGINKSFACWSGYNTSATKMKCFSLVNTGALPLSCTALNTLIQVLPPSKNGPMNDICIHLHPLHSVGTLWLHVSNNVTWKQRRHTMHKAMHGLLHPLPFFLPSNTNDALIFYNPQPFKLASQIDPSLQPMHALHADFSCISRAI